ncbi:MAG: hypothetical protein ACOCY5_03790, partial [Desulfohalobiaceae bacterium]
FCRFTPSPAASVATRIRVPGSLRRDIAATIIAVRTTRAMTTGYLRDLDREASGGTMGMPLDGEVAGYFLWISKYVGRE